VFSKNLFKHPSPRAYAIESIASSLRLKPRTQSRRNSDRLQAPERMIGKHSPTSRRKTVREKTEKARTSFIVRTS